MNNFFSILYAASSIGFILACSPQLIHIIRSKTVEGLSLQTYDMWFALQVIAMPYIYQTGDAMWIVGNIFWCAYYLTMALLIQHYRYPHYIRVIVDKLVHVLRFVPVPVHHRN